MQSLPCSHLFWFYKMLLYFLTFFFFSTDKLGCNSDCLCSLNEWDPVCGKNSITYVSPCLAGCTTSTGSGKDTVRTMPFKYDKQTKKKKLFHETTVNHSNMTKGFPVSMTDLLLCRCVSVTFSCLSRSSLTVAVSPRLETLRPVQVIALKRRTATGCSRTSLPSLSSLPSSSPLGAHQATCFSSG